MLTPEQVQERKKYIGGSDIAVIMGHSPYKKPLQLWLEKSGQVEQEDISHLAHVMRGNNYESIAREEVEKKYNKKFPQAFIKKGNFAANMDGLSDDAVLEIKVMGLAAHIETSVGEIPFHYELQLRWYLMLAEKETGIFASYRPEDETLYTLEIKRDADLEQQMVEAAVKFWRHVTDMTRPDGEHITDDMTRLTTEWLALKQKLTEIETQFSVVDSELKEAFNKTGLKNMQFGGLKMSRVVRAGSVQYKNIPELQNVDLNSYRGPDTEYVKIT